MVSFTLSSIFVVCYENVIFQSVLCILVYCIKPEIMKRSESERICEWFTSQKEKYLWCTTVRHKYIYYISFRVILCISFYLYSLY